MQSESEPSGEPLLLALQRATHATLHGLSSELAALGLSAAEMNALANLADSAGRTVSELAGAVGTRTTTLTGVLDRLEGRGHIKRIPHATDRRAIVVQLTRPGGEAAATVVRAMRDLERRAFAQLPTEAVDSARRILQALTADAR